MGADLAQTIATISGAVAAIFSAIAAIQARNQAKEARALWALERRSEAFRSLVREPIMRALDAFLAESRVLLSEGAAEVVRAASTGSSDEEVENRRGDLIDRFNRLFLGYRERLRQARMISNSDDFKGELASLTEGLQDAVTAFVAELAEGQDPEESCFRLLTDHAAGVDRLAVRFDPALDQTEEGGGRWTPAVLLRLKSGS